MEGGYYYSSFRRVRNAHGEDQWKFTNLTLDMVWTLGDSKGLNEPHAEDAMSKFSLLDGK